MKIHYEFFSIYYSIIEEFAWYDKRVNLIFRCMRLRDIFIASYR